MEISLKIIWYSNIKKHSEKLQVRTRKDLSLLLGKEIAAKSMAQSDIYKLQTAIYIIFLGIAIAFFDRLYSKFLVFLLAKILNDYFSSVEKKHIDRYNNSSVE